MLQPCPCTSPEEGSTFSFHDDNSTQRQYRTPHGPQSSSQFNWQCSQSSSTYRDYNGGSTSQDDDNNNRPSGRPSYSRYNQSYQQESYRGNESQSYSQPEPQFGPSSRTEFMELSGEDEIEMLREGTYVTESAKTGFICTKYTYSFYLFLCGLYNICKFY